MYTLTLTDTELAAITDVLNLRADYLKFTAIPQTDHAAFRNSYIAQLITARQVLSQIAELVED